MGFTGIDDVVNAINGGAESFCSFNKQMFTLSTSVPAWVDLSMTFGNPFFNYYPGAPLTASVLNDFDGILHGDNKAPAQKILTHLGLVSPASQFVGAYKLLDYLLFYADIRMDSSLTQNLVNTTPLPRYATGEGVLPMLVSLQSIWYNGTFSFTYIDQNGNPQTSPVQTYNTNWGAYQGNLASGQMYSTGASSGPFLQLASGSTGVRSITSWTNYGLAQPSSGSGLAVVVLVKPLVDTAIREANTVTEISFIDQHTMPPVILDGAYLNFLACFTANPGGSWFSGYAKFAWH